MAVRRRQVRQLGGKRLLIALVIVCLAAAGLCTLAEKLKKISG